MIRATFTSALALAGLLALSACDRRPRTLRLHVPAGEPRRGPELLRRYGCHSCHTIEGVRAARGDVGPPLTGIGKRAFIAGLLPNTPENLIRWIVEPQAIQPGNAMPDVGVGEDEARDMAAYLYSLD